MSKTATETSRRLRSGAVIAVAIGVMNLSTYGYTVLAAHPIGKEAYGAFSALMGALLVISVLSLGLQATGARRISAEPDQVVAIERVVLGVGLRSALVLGALCLRWPPSSTPCSTSHSLPTALLVGAGRVPAHLHGRAGRRAAGRAALGAAGAGLPGPGAGPALPRPRADRVLAHRVRGDGRRRAGLLAAGASSAALALSRPAVGRGRTARVTPGSTCIREVGHSSQALLAFFALSNADILVARATMSNSQAGLYAAGLIMAKAILFLPQFVVVYAFPSMSKEETNRRTLLLALGLSATLGAIGVLATLAASGPRAALRRRQRLRADQGRPVEVRDRRHACCR